MNKLFYKEAPVYLYFLGGWGGGGGGRVMKQSAWSYEFQNNVTESKFTFQAPTDTCTQHKHTKIFLRQRTCFFVIFFFCSTSKYQNTGLLGDKLHIQYQ